MAAECGGKIEDPFLLLSDNYRRAQLCTMMNKPELILIRLIDDVPHVGPNYDSIYDNNNEQFFNVKCQQLGQCRTSILITVFFQARKIRITTGSEINRVIPIYQRQVIINNMKPYLQNNNFFGAFEYAINTVVSQLPAVHEYPHSSSSSGFGTFLYVLFIILIVLCCVYCLYYAMTQNSNNEITEVTESEIHDHFDKLMDLVKYKIRTSSPPMISIEQCLVCMKFLNPNWESELNSNESESHLNLKKFNCGHFFHKHCLENRGINKCLLCKDSTFEVPVEPCIRYYHPVSEDSIFNLINNFDLLYPRDTLKRYNTVYKQDVVVIQQTYPSYPFILWVEPTHYYGYDSCYNVNQPYSNLHEDYSNNNYTAQTMGGDYGYSTGCNDFGGYGGNYQTNVNQTTGSNYQAPSYYGGGNTTSGGDYGGDYTTGGGDFGGGFSSGGGDY